MRRASGYYSLACCALCCLIVAGSEPVFADDEDDSLRCINVRSIRSADVIDDDHVAFEVQGRRLYLNKLPKSCVGLSRDRRFAFASYVRSLCEHDKIQILRGSGSGFYGGRYCSLGRFQPITHEKLQQFIDERSEAAAEPVDEEPDQAVNE